MKRRPPTHRRQRHVRLIRMLCGGTLTAEAIAAELGVTVRTIYRDVEHLKAEGVPVVGEAGVGYHLEGDILLDRLSLGVVEGRALVWAIHRALPAADARTARHLRDVLTAIDRRVPEAVREALRPDEGG